MIVDGYQVKFSNLTQKELMLIESLGLPYVVEQMMKCVWNKDTQGSLLGLSAFCKFIQDVELMLGIGFLCISQFPGNYRGDLVLSIFAITLIILMICQSITSFSLLVKTSSDSVFFEHLSFALSRKSISSYEKFTIPFTFYKSILAVFLTYMMMNSVGSTSAFLYISLSFVNLLCVILFKSMVSHCIGRSINLIKSK
jgi:hypothetical protein